METAITVKKANYLKGYTIKLLFSDNTSQNVDFSDFFSTHSHPQYNKYKNIEKFKDFNIEDGNVVWGKNWDLIFPIHQLYQGKII
ncbi:MAG: DUF2442 domain-containing protein [Lentimicrobiaceae bacterium]|nr:DUF2442 domain-containing protein [Lentimicrobiaceae bacterium]